MGIIELQNVCKQYNGNYVLHDINLCFEKGQIIGYIGPNGAGKSTTIKILAGIINSFEGKAHLLGMDVRKDALLIKQQIGYIPELASMYDVLTPMEYLCFIGKLYKTSADAIEKKSNDLLQLFDLEEKKNIRMSSFSKGMKQKVLLISGLMHNPKVIFFDEPLSGLDANAVILVKEILNQLKQAGKTIFYSSHIMDVVEKISDRIIIINNGSIIADGTFKSLKENAHLGTLENIFTALTGEEKHESVAKEFVDILKANNG